MKSSAAFRYGYRRLVAHVQAPWKGTSRRGTERNPGIVVVAEDAFVDREEASGVQGPQLRKSMGSNH
jgi:hypothetical protein